MNSRSLKLVPFMRSMSGSRKRQEALCRTLRHCVGKASQWPGLIARMG